MNQHVAARLRAISLVTSVTAVMGWALAVPSARADVPPEPGYVEQCTVELQSRAGRECRACSTYHGNPPDHCATEVGAGFTRSCRSRGASTWSEVWCRDVAGSQPTGTTGTAEPSPEPTTASTGQASTSDEEAEDCSTASTSGIGWPVAAGLLGLALLRRRTART